MDNKPTRKERSPSLWEEVVEWLREFPGEFARCWDLLPNKGLFFTLLAAWLLLFQFYGNATFGYIDSASLMYWMWFSYNNPMAHGEDGHGNFIPFVVLALFWWKRKKLLALSNHVWRPGLLLLATALALHVVGYMVQQPRICIVAMFTGIYALMGLAWGPGWLKACLFPYFLFVFNIPITSVGEPATVPLRLFVTKVVAGISGNFLGVDVRREGNILFNSAHNYQYEVAAACSGLQSLIAIFALATVYAFVFLDKNWKRTLMVASALPLAIISNIMRMMCIIIAAEMWGQEGGDYVHGSAIFSIMPYLPAIVGIIILGNWLQASPVPTLPPASPKPA